MCQLLYVPVPLPGVKMYKVTLIFHCDLGAISHVWFVLEKLQALIGDELYVKLSSLLMPSLSAWFAGG